jgi:hypothetical protein
MRSAGFDRHTARRRDIARRPLPSADSGLLRARRCNRHRRRTFRRSRSGRSHDSRCRNRRRWRSSAGICWSADRTSLPQHSSRSRCTRRSCGSRRGKPGALPDIADQRRTRSKDPKTRHNGAPANRSPRRPDTDRATRWSHPPQRCQQRYQCSQQHRRRRQPNRRNQQQPLEHRTQSDRRKPALTRAPRAEGPRPRRGYGRASSPSASPLA